MHVDMTRSTLPRCTVPGLRVIELTADHEGLLQRFFDANPLYFRMVQGEPAPPHEAHEAIHGELPAGWSFTRKWLIGYARSDGSLAGMASIVSDLLAPSVWHIGLFIVETRRHGSGDAHLLCKDLETWAAASGAKWLRLGVVEANRRGARFWLSQGFVESRVREGVELGQLTHRLRVLFKPLADGTLEEYRTMVPRDRPEPPSSA
jgi:GNAT superfamily N-acetyltransferase